MVKRVRDSWVLLLLGAVVVGLLALTGCGSSESDPARGLGDQVRQSEQAVTPTEQTLSLSVELPTEISRENASVVARNALTLGDRASIVGDSSANRGELIVGYDARVGTVRSALALRLRDRSRVEGNAIAGGSVVRGTGSVVTGTVQANRPITRETKTWSVKAPATSQGPITVEGDTRKLLAPGTYGALIVRPRGTLTLQSGIYVFDSVLLEPQSQLRIASTAGPVQVIIKQAFTHRGAIGATDRGIPQLIVGYLGTTLARIEASFTGALIAPNADLLFSAARPAGHRAFIHGKTVTFEPDAVVAKYPMDWTAVLGPTAYMPPAPGTPVYELPSPSLSSSQVDVPGDATGPVTVTKTLGTAVSFELPATYPVSGGTLGNGIVTLTFSEAGGTEVICTYQGGSSTAQPATAQELNLGRTMHFVSCSDGLPAATTRRADSLDVTVTPSPGYPVSVLAPITKDGSCGELLELLTPAETYSMVENFDWSTRPKVAERDAQNRPTLFYAWVYVADEDDLYALRKLFIHRLQRPLFADELSKFDDRCGAITNPGDGRGQFVPALIPGITYNKMIDALTSTEVDGDREIFEAVILRDPPASVRTPQGSVDFDQLKASGFRYLSYEADAFAPPPAIGENAFVAKIVTDVLSWVGQAAQDAAAWFGQAFGDLSVELNGGALITFHMQALNLDSDFGRTPLIRAWGPWRGAPLAAEGVEVTMLQWFGPMIPSEEQGRTNLFGAVNLEIAQNNIRGNGLCMELGSPAAIITDFLVPSGLCDFRSWDPATGQQGLPFSWLPHVTAQRAHLVLSEHPRVSMLYQADDVYQYSKQVIGFTPKQARILGGAWAETFSQSDSDGKLPYAPCLNYANSFSDTAAMAAALGGGIGGTVVAAVLPGLGTAAVAIAGTVAYVGASVLFNSDIVVPESSPHTKTRHTMTHEYGHYLLCSLMQDWNMESIDHLVWGTIFNTAGYTSPVVNLNEAFADFITGQVAGGAVYHWFNAAQFGVNGATLQGNRPGFCTPPLVATSGPWCWDTNLRGSTLSTSTGRERFRSIGRFATLFHDVFDGSGLGNTAVAPYDADFWMHSSSSGSPPVGALPLILAGGNYNNTDSGLERVALPGPAIRRMAQVWAEGLESFPVTMGPPPILVDPIDERKIYMGLNQAMLESTPSTSWCDRARVLALHQVTDTLSVAPTVAELFLVGQNDPFLAGVLGPPPADARRLRAEDCQMCPPGLVTAPDGSCQVGCPPDVVLNGVGLGGNVTTTLSFDTNTSPPGDLCPELFILRIDNFDAIAMAAMEAELGPAIPSAASCGLAYSLKQTTSLAGTLSTSTASIAPGQGTYNDCVGGGVGCVVGCTALPMLSFLQGAGQTVEFEALAGASLGLEIRAVIK